PGVRAVPASSPASCSAALCCSNNVADLASHFLTTIVPRQLRQEDDPRWNRLLADLLRAPGLKGRLREAPPSFEHHRCSNDLARDGIGKSKCTGFLNARMLLQKQLNLLGHDLDPAAIDLMLAAAENPKPAIRVDLADVARAEPASAKGFARHPRVVEIAAHERRIAEQHLAVAVLRQSAIVTGHAPA